jgi:hypothetical protein
VTTRIRREKHRPLWRRAGLLVPLVLLALGLGVGIRAWHLGGPVPVRAMAVALPDSDVGSAAAASSGIGG